MGHGTTPRGTRVRGTLVRAAVLLSGIVTALAWALASPPGSAPDDNYHLASIWCAQGLQDDRCREVPENPTQRLVPAEVLQATCFTQDPAKSGGCQAEMEGTLIPDSPTSSGNWTGIYPPVFYLFMSLFITDGLYSSILLMRLANALVVLLSVSSLFLLVPRRMRPVAAIPLLVTSVPLGISLLVSTNPSAWTFLSAALVWPALYASFETGGWRRLALVGHAVGMSVLGAGSRADGALFTAMACGMVLALRVRVLKANVPAVLGCIACTVIAGVLFVTAGQSEVVSTGFGTPGAPTPWLQLAVSNLQSLPFILFGGLGFGFMGSIGWLDTPFPPLVGFLTTVVWAAVVFAGWRTHSFGKVVALAITGGALVTYPLFMLGQSGLVVGEGFQPRYALPLLVMFTGVSLLVHRGAGVVRHGLSHLQVAMAAGALAVAHLIALYTQIRRYVTGLDVSGLDLDGRREWWWEGPLSASAVWWLGSFGFAVLTVLLLRTAAGRPTELPGMDEADRELATQP